MISKKNRISKKEIDKVFSFGSFLNSKSFSLKYFIDKDSKKRPSVAFVVSKKVSKSAVNRNKCRRLGFNAIREYIPLLPAGFMGVFIYKNTNILENDLKEEISFLLKKIS